MPDTPHRSRVLVADDDDAIRRLVSHLLRGAGFDTVEAVNGQDAIDRIDSSEFDAVVVDLMMPRVDGTGVIRHLAEAKPSMVEKTIVMTAYPEAAELRRVDPICRILPKPFNRDELIERVADCVARQGS